MSGKVEKKWLLSDVTRRKYNLKNLEVTSRVFFCKRVSLTFGNPATFMATPQHLINASVPAPNTLIK